MPKFSSALAHFRNHWKILLIGQLLSFLFSCMGASQASLALDCASKAPMFPLFLFYCALCPFLCCCRRKAHPSETSGAAADDDGDNDTKSCDERDVGSTHCMRLCAAAPKPVIYFFMALLDVYANYFIFMSLSYTTLTSATLLDALAVPSAMVLSRCCLRRSYTLLHLVGVIVCLIGVVVNVSSDYESVENNTAVESTMVKGDLLAICGGIIFGINKVLGEVSVRNFGGPYEYLGFIGMFGAILSGLHSAVFERQATGQTYFRDGATCTGGQVWCLVIAFVISGLFSYTGSAQFLLFSEATFLNLSLLTADAWSLGFSILAERIIPDPMFYLAFCFTLAGVIIYEMAPTPILEDREAEEAGAEAATGQSGGDLELKVNTGENA